MEKKNAGYTFVRHPFPPVADNSCRILILGSLPSVKSRENCSYYGHPQNRFWRLLAAVYGVAVPQTIPEKTTLLLSHHIALWDVIAECEIAGSSDSSIRNAVPNDLDTVFSAAPIERIFANGTKAYDLYQKYDLPRYGRAIQKLPSTSPANAAYSLERLTAVWKPALE